MNSIRTAVLLAAYLAMSLLSACGGSDSSAPPPPTASTVSGTVASGTALTGTVSVYDSSTNSQPRISGATIGTGGQYTVTVTGFTAPFLLQATGQVGGQGPTVTLYSVATAAGTVNITPITTLMALNMAGGNIQSLQTGSTGSLSGLTAADLTDQNNNMDTLLASNLAAQGLSSSYNFSTASFTTGSTGYDQLLDNVAINTANPAAVTVTNVNAPASSITIDTAAGTPSGTLDITSGPSSLPTQPSVPNVVGDTQTAAASALTAAGLTVGTVTQSSSATVASGVVISENPASGASVAAGSAVALTVSSGPPTFTVGGIVIGLAPSATVNVLNGTDNAPVAVNGSFTLPTSVVSGGTYSVTVGTPTSSQSCGVQNASGTIASANVTNIVVYCTYNVSAATLHSTYSGVAANFGNVANATYAPLDIQAATTFDGVGATSIAGSVNFDGTVFTNVTESGVYAVTTTNAIPNLGGAGGIGGIEGVNADAVETVDMTSGTPSTLAISVLPDTTATTNSVNGNYAFASLTALLGTGQIEADEGPATMTNGSISGTYTSNIAGTSVTGNQRSGTFTVANGLVSSGNQGAVSADDDLVVIADTTNGDNPNVGVLVRQGTGVTLATFQGVYSVSQYGGTGFGATFAKAATFYAHGDGTFTVTLTKNSNGTITSDTGSGTVTLADDGTMTFTDADGNVGNGAISADGNALVLAYVSSNETPSIIVGVRQ